MEKTSISSEETSSRFRGSINGAILHSLLKSFGNLRHFVFERRVANEDDVSHHPLLIWRQLTDNF